MADIGIGSPRDVAQTNPAATAGVVALLKGLLTRLNASATLVPGTAALTTSAAAISTSATVQEVLVQSDPANSADVLVGDSSAQPIRLRPGQSLVIPVANLATVYAKAATGTATLNYLGRS